MTACHVVRRYADSAALMDRLRLLADRLGARPVNHPGEDLAA